MPFQAYTSASGSAYESYYLPFTSLYPNQKLSAQFKSERGAQLRWNMQDEQGNKLHV